MRTMRTGSITTALIERLGMELENTGGNCLAATLRLPETFGAFVLSGAEDTLPWHDDPRAGYSLWLRPGWFDPDGDDDLDRAECLYESNAFNFEATMFDVLGRDWPEFGEETPGFPAAHLDWLRCEAEAVADALEDWLAGRGIRFFDGQAA